MVDLSIRTDRATFALEVAVVAVVGLALATHTIQSWAAPASPFVWSTVALLLFGLYRLLRYACQSAAIDQPTDESARVDAGHSSETRAEATDDGSGDAAPEPPDGGDGDDLRVPAGEDYESGESDETTAYLDWEAAKKAGLVSGGDPSSAQESATEESEVPSSSE